MTDSASASAAQGGPWAPPLFNSLPEVDRETLEAWARGEAAPSEAARALEGASGGGGGAAAEAVLVPVPVPSPAPSSSALVGNAAAFDTAFDHAFTPPQGRHPANAEPSHADFASSLYRRAGPAPELGASAADMHARSGAAEVQSWAKAAAAAAAPPQPNQVAELSEARRAYKALQATADAAKAVARRLKYSVAHDHPDDHRHVKWGEASSGPGGAKAALEAKLTELRHATPHNATSTPKHGEVHEHTRDDGSKQTRYLVTSRKAAPLDAKVTPLTPTHTLTLTHTLTHTLTRTLT